MESPILSVIIPAYNSAKTLDKALQSIVNQTFLSYDCWVIDGASTDGTKQILANYHARFPKIKYHSAPDKGIYDAMNKGIALSGGSFLYFMGSDDELSDEKVFEKIFGSEPISSVDFIYGKVVFKYSGLPFGGQMDYFKIIRNLENICHQAIFYKRSIFDKHGIYDLRFPIYADFNLNVKCFADNSLVKKYIDLVICIFNEKGASFTRGNTDFFIQDLHASYITDHENPVALYASSKFAERQVVDLLNSRDYRLGKKIGNTVRRIKRLFRISPATKV
jgi:glycosyltransferase involved in cell wall biosynthesis